MVFSHSAYQENIILTISYIFVVLKEEKKCGILHASCICYLIVDVYILSFNYFYAVKDDNGGSEYTTGQASHEVYHCCGSFKSLYSPTSVCNEL